MSQHDGCSGGLSVTWRRLRGRAPPWEGCCDLHDHAYGRGGNRRARFTADVALLECIESRGYPKWAVLCFLAVRLCGRAYWPSRPDYLPPEH